MLADIIKQFSKRFHKYKISYKKGVYYIPYLGNGPEATVESFKQTPFMNWSDETSLLQQKSFLLEGFGYFYEIEKGLWVFASEIHYKKNVEFKLYFDDELPSDYFIFSLNNLRNDSKNGVALLNGIPFQTNSWNFFKPLSKRSVLNFKNTTHLTIGLFVTENWLNNHLSQKALPNSHHFFNYINHTLDYRIFPNIDGHFIDTYAPMLNELKRPKSEQQRNSLLTQAKAFLDDVLDSFERNPMHSIEGLDPLMFSKLVRIEHLLNNSILIGFPGIEALAEAIQVSPSKLKTDFKLAYNQSLFQYFRRLQMNFARQQLLSANIPIKELAFQLGYEHAGKFSVAFKKEFGISPSEVMTSKV